MLALLILMAVIVAIMAVMVTGLLRSHADILKILHDLGADITANASSGPVPLDLGAKLPSERESTSAPPISGVTPFGDAISTGGSGGGLLLLSFLSSGCTTCAEFWQSFQAPQQLGFPAGIRLVVVTKGPELEVPSEVQSRSGSAVEVIMSTQAWIDYEVPGSPFFILVDGAGGRRLGEGIANHFSQVVEMIRRADADKKSFIVPVLHDEAGLTGPEREADNDTRLLAAGITPGHASLYPTSLEDIMEPASEPLSIVDSAGTHSPRKG